MQKKANKMGLSEYMIAFVTALRNWGSVWKEEASSA